jgi:hypothetical protein
MSVNLAFMDTYASERTADFLREAERDRLADEVVRTGQPLRVRLAQRLRATAEWIEGEARQPAIEATA